jgi:hypothetical protein
MKASSCGPVHWFASCTNCGWSCGARNAVAVGSQHAEHHGHTVHVEVGIVYIFGAG